MTELQEQISLIKQARMHPICRTYLLAFSNGGKRSKITGAHMKMSGQVKGTPDLFLAYPSGKFHGLFIELKRPASKIPGHKSRSKGELTAEQMIMIKYLNDAGYKATVAYGAEQAWKIITEYLANGNGKNPI